MSELISRRKMLSVLGLAAAAATAAPSALLTVSSEAGAQPTPQVDPLRPQPSTTQPGTAPTGTERRQERRTGRVKRRVSRRKARRKGRAQRRELRRGD
jgi:hypothetical protein